MDWSPAVTYGFIAFLSGFLGGWVMAALAPRLHLIDVPNERSSHTQPVAKGGGVGLLAAFVMTGILLRIPLSFVVPLGVLSVVSFAGDRWHIPPIVRLIVQTVAAVCVVGSVFLRGAGIGGGTILVLILGVVYLVGTANMYNFMDGIDGIAGITGFVGFALLAAYLFLSGRFVPFGMLALCLSLSCAGFLLWNVPRARVFMGDVGSILLGSAFAATALFVSNTVYDVAVISLLIFPFYADEITTATLRLRDGENLLRPHRRHLYQVLANECGVPHWKVTAGYGAVQFLMGCGALFLAVYEQGMLLAAFISAGIGGWIILSCYVRRRAVRHY